MDMTLVGKADRDDVFLDCGGVGLKILPRWGRQCLTCFQAELSTMIGASDATVGD